MTRERGSMLPMFAGLLFVSFTILTLAVEIALLGAAWRLSADVADIAAEAGAAMIDQSRLHTDGLTMVDRQMAGPVAILAAEGLGVASADVSIEVEPALVCVTIRIRHSTRGLRFIGVAEIPVEVSRCAAPAIG